MAAAWQRVKKWGAQVSVVPSCPSSYWKELQTGGAERGLPPTPPRPEAARPSVGVLGFPAAYSAAALGPEGSSGLLQVLPVCPALLTAALPAGCLSLQLPQVGTQNLVLPQLTYGQGRPLVVSSGHEKPIETRRDTKDRGHRGHSHACSWFVPHGEVRSDRARRPAGEPGGTCARHRDTLLSPSSQGVTARGTRMPPPRCFVEDGARRQAGMDERATEHESD